MLPRRRKRPHDIDDFFGGEFFKDLNEEFREMEKNMARTFDEFRKLAEREPREGGPYVYGFSMRVGPDGKPHLEKFGNIPRLGGEKLVETSQREPLTDIIEREGEISVVVELPGIEKEDVNLDISEDSLTIDVNTAKRKYHKELRLPGKVKTNAAKATYKNGVLEVKLRRVEEKKPSTSGVKIKVD